MLCVLTVITWCYLLPKLVKLKISGNSLSITVPKEPLRELGWKKGDYVSLEVKTIDAGFGQKKVLEATKLVNMP